jgi:hypothetical protein
MSRTEKIIVFQNLTYRNLQPYIYLLHFVRFAKLKYFFYLWKKTANKY